MENFNHIEADFFNPTTTIKIKINKENSGQIARALTSFTFILYKRFNEKSSLNLFEEIKLNQDFLVIFVNLLSRANINMENKKQALLQIEKLLNELTQKAIETKQGGIS